MGVGGGGTVMSGGPRSPTHKRPEEAVDHRQNNYVNPFTAMSLENVQ